jgi:hypothetical protein
MVPRSARLSPGRTHSFVFGATAVIADTVNGASMSRALSWRKKGTSGEEIVESLRSQRSAQESRERRSRYTCRSCPRFPLGYLTQMYSFPASRAHRTDVRDSRTLLGRATTSACEKQEPEDRGGPEFLNRLVLRVVQARPSVDDRAILTRSELSEDLNRH